MTERARALELLRRIERESLYASILLIGETGFVRTLVLGVLRWRSRLDHAIETFAGRRIGKLDSLVVDVLRIGVYQLHFMDVAAGGQRILDVAAAPGGKTLYMQHGGASVTSSDVSIARLRPLAGRQPRLLVADGRNLPFRTRFPVVLLDAPCSATGTIRKNPEIKWRLRESDLLSFVRLQKELLASAMAIADDAVVYSTCSLEREENDDIVSAFARDDIAPFVPAGARAWAGDGVLRLTPESGADGFTAFVLRRSR
ncbi:MAG: hypothetical protein NVSMB68_12320 [Thermoanaerobaculia bacterium]